MKFNNDFEFREMGIFGLDLAEMQVGQKNQLLHCL